MRKIKVVSVLSLIVLLFGTAFATVASARDDGASNEWASGRNCRRVRVCSAYGCWWRTVCSYSVNDQEGTAAAVEGEDADENAQEAQPLDQSSLKLSNPSSWPTNP